MLPENNILGFPANTKTLAVSDGNWVFMKPLDRGYHEISFRGDVTEYLLIMLLQIRSRLHRDGITVQLISL